jgi:hypothetical protein
MADGAFAELADLCERSGWDLGVEHSHDHGHDREGFITVTAGESLATLKAAGESWDSCAETVLRKLRTGERP